MTSELGTEVVETFDKLLEYADELDSISGLGHLAGAAHRIIAEEIRKTIHGVYRPEGFHVGHENICLVCDTEFPCKYVSDK